VRVVSLDYCADQFVVKLADRGAIAAVSRDAVRSFSYLREEARGLPRVRASAEEVLALAPDLVVRSYGGGAALAGQLERAGVRVHQIGWGEDFDAVRANVRAAAVALGQRARGEALVAAFDARLAALRQAAPLETLYVTAAGVTTGPGSMIHTLMASAGLANFQTRPGWNPLPLERLAADQPDLVATAFFDTGAGAAAGDTWSPARHPLAQRMMRDVPVVALDGATTSCAGWFVLDAVEALARAGPAR
jgi:iron complex transport system substrate-binding protein